MTTVLGLEEHAAFILISYAITVAVVVGLVVWVVLDRRGRERDLAALEARGARRRSAGGRP